MIVKECRPDDECEYACGVDDKRSRARLFVEGEILVVIYRCLVTGKWCLVTANFTVMNT